MGNLPTSRTVTLNPSDPVPSSLLNELQDKIIAGSYGDIPLLINGEMFAVDTSFSAGVPTRVRQEWTFTASAGNRILAPLILPVGTVIRSATYSMRVVTAPGTGGNINIFSRSYGDGGAGLNYVSVGGVAIPGSPAAYAARTFISAPITITDNVMYEISVQTGGAIAHDVRFDGVRLVIGRS